MKFFNSQSLRSEMYLLPYCGITHPVTVSEPKPTRVRLTSGKPRSDYNVADHLRLTDIAVFDGTT